MGRYQHARRIWLTDRHLSAISAELRDSLGDWIIHRLRHGVNGQGEKAQAILDSSGIPVDELQSEWELQKTAQMSIRARKPYIY